MQTEQKQQIRKTRFQHLLLLPSTRIRYVIGTEFSSPLLIHKHEHLIFHSCYVARYFTKSMFYFLRCMLFHEIDFHIRSFSQDTWRKPREGPVRRHDPPWLESVSVTPELIYQYQLRMKSLEEILESDLKALKRTQQVNHRCGSYL